MPSTAHAGLAERITQATKLHEGGNTPLYFWNCYEVQHLLTLLTFDDLLPEEVMTLAVTLATAYGRKLAGTPVPGLRLVPKLADGSEYLAG